MRNNTDKRKAGQAAGLAIAVLLLLCPACCNAADLLVAVASNFKPTAELLAARFRTETGIDTRLSSASTGILSAQIRQGAPFDIFLAADTRHVQELKKIGLIEAASVTNYAIGELVLVVSTAAVIDDNLALTLKNLRTSKQRIAIANPATAPYGRAAQQTLNNLGAWQAGNGNVVRANNIAQCLQYVTTRHVAAAFTARALLRHVRLSDDLAVISVPAHLHSSIMQQAAMLAHTPHAKQATAFIRFLRSARARQLIGEEGYRLPPSQTTDVISH